MMTIQIEDPGCNCGMDDLGAEGHEGANTEVSYQYADAGNNKQHRTVVFAGPVTQALVDAAANNAADQYLLDEDVIALLPQQVGLPTLWPGAYVLTLDHIWHTITSIELVRANVEPTQDRTAREFFAWLSEVEWDEMAAIDDLTSRGW